MSTEHLSNLPYLVALFMLIAAMLVLQRRQSRLAIGGWMAALDLIFLSQLSWYFAELSPNWHIAMHVVRLCADLSAGFVFLLFAGRKLPETALRTFIPLWHLVPLLGLEAIYGLDITDLRFYLGCAGAGVVVCILVAVRTRQSRQIASAQILVWIAIAAFSFNGNDRAAAYWGLAAVYAAAAVHLWSRLRHGTLGRAAIALSLGIWALSFFAHPWILPHPQLRSVAESVWSMQKFFVTFSMFVLLLETVASENEQLAMCDQLTGVANRRRLEQRLGEAIATGSADILLLDLDGFKEINDSFGHLAGDEVLIQTAARLSRALEPGDTLARMGGDEFIVISKGEMEPLVQAVTATLLPPFVVEGGTAIKVRASIGISSYPVDAKGKSGAEAIRHLLRAADSNMYEQKKRQADGSAPPLSERRLHRGHI